MVVDASVAVKWFLANPEERDSDIAVAILESAVLGNLVLRQPPHFVAEVASVLIRLKGQDALLDVADLLEIRFERVDDDETYARGMDLALRLDHHPFDTLYHAVALSAPETMLITADRRYFRKARSVGQVALLGQWQRP